MAGFNFSLDDLDHIEDYGLKKKKLDRQFFMDEFNRQQKEYELSCLHIDKILNEEPLSDKEKEQFDKYSDKLVAVYKVNDSLNNLIYRVIKQFGNKVNLNWINVSDMKNFSGAFAHTSFNGDISNWEIQGGADCSYMFALNVSDMKNFSGMFAHTSFNGDLSSWEIQDGADCSYMFAFSEFDKWDKLPQAIKDALVKKSNGIDTDIDITGIFYQCKGEKDLLKRILEEKKN